MAVADQLGGRVKRLQFFTAPAPAVGDVNTVTVAVQTTYSQLEQETRADIKQTLKAQKPAEQEMEETTSEEKGKLKRLASKKLIEARRVSLTTITTILQKSLESLTITRKSVTAGGAVGIPIRTKQVFNRCTASVGFVSTKIGSP